MARKKPNVPKRIMIFCIRDGASYRSVYTPMWRPGDRTADQAGVYGYWSAYAHHPDGNITGMGINLSNCLSFEQVHDKISKSTAYAELPKGTPIYQASDKLTHYPK